TPTSSSPSSGRPEPRNLSWARPRSGHVFEGGGYGVAVTAAPVVPPPWPVEMPPLGIDGRPVRLGQLMPTGRRTPEQKARELERVARVEGQLAAYKVEIVASLARDRADARSSSDDDDHLPGVEESSPTSSR
ncbi:MAG: hypothetical protein ACLGI3_06935, partial [Actinomycetes bacterium]